MALNLLICDDDTQEIARLERLLDTYAQRTGTAFQVTSCSAPRDILEELEHSDRFDVMFLDIYLDSLNGLDLARLIRRENTRSKLIFVSTSQDHALEAFGVNASQYLVKPVAYNALAQTLDRLLALEPCITVANGAQLVRVPLGELVYTETQRHYQALFLVNGTSELDRLLALEPCITVANGAQLVRVPLGELVYTETQRHYQALFLVNGTSERARMTRAELCELLGQQKRFARVGASFLVNLDYVIRISADGVELQGGRVIHVPRRALAELKQQYFDYYCEEDPL